MFERSSTAGTRQSPIVHHDAGVSPGLPEEMSLRRSSRFDPLNRKT